MQDMLEPEDIFNPRNYDSVRRRFAGVLGEQRYRERGGKDGHGES